MINLNNFKKKNFFGNLQNRKERQLKINMQPKFYLLIKKKGSLASILQAVQKGLADYKYDNTTPQKILIDIAMT